MTSRTCYTQSVPSTISRLIAALALVPALGVTVSAMAQPCVPAQTATLNTSDPGRTAFGSPVDIDGNFAIVGDPRDDVGADRSGAAYVFVRTAAGWVQQAKLKSNTPGEEDFLGLSVAISGDIAVVAEEYNPRAHVFRRVGNNWSFEVVLTGTDFVPADRHFSNRVAINGQTILLSVPEVPLDSNILGPEGVVYVFVHSNGTWSLQARLLPDLDMGFTNFGGSLAIDGDTALVGANFDNSAGSDAGAGYVFVRNAGVWTRQAKLISLGSPGDPAAGELLGISASLSGDTAFLGASTDDVAANTSGSAYVFVRSGTIWSQQAKLISPIFAEDPDLAGERFGASLRVAGETAVVCGVASESAYVFNRAGSIWSPSARLTAPPFQGSGPFASERRFPASAGLSNGTVVLGAFVSNSGLGFTFPSSDVARIYELLGPDTDFDGSPDCTDGCPNDAAKTAPGLCGCGQVDLDTDSDGTPDCNDACPTDPARVVPGRCGCGNPETDTDADGTPDCIDACPNDPTKSNAGRCGCGMPETDTDADGTPDCVDECPNDPAKAAPGACGCGATDNDDDGDGAPNCIDGCPNDATKLAPGACGCGRADTDADADGTPDCNDGCPNDAAKVAPGKCGCGKADTDSDADGVADCEDGCPGDAAKVAPGACGCGTPENDSDRDGTPDCIDGCPNDAAKVAPGKCGCDKADTDSDADGVPDCTDNCLTAANPLQTDADGDGLGDACDATPETGGTGGCPPGACGVSGAAFLPLAAIAMRGMRTHQRRRARASRACRR